MAGGMQMTWDDWNPYLGVDYRLTGTVALICLLGAVILEIRAFRRRKALFLYSCAGRRNNTYSGRNAGKHLRKNTVDEPGKFLWKGLLWFYVFTILCATVLGRSGGREPEFSLELFWTLKAALATGNWRYWYFIVGNILLFVPLGFLLWQTVPDRPWKTVRIVILCFFLSVLVETIQYVTGTGFSELDDFFHNTLGGWLGCGAGALYRRIFHGRKQSEQKRKALGHKRNLNGKRTF